MGRAYEVRKFKMEKTSQAKTKVYSKYGREIYMAAKSGIDPSLNSELQRIIEKAKKDQVPNDIIDRAIKKATNNNTENYDKVIYEGFGPGGSSLIITTLTDNTNRTYSEIRACFNKAHAKLGVNGSVAHTFNYCALFEIINTTDEAVLEALISEGLEPQDIAQEEDSVSVIIGVPDFANTKKALQTINGAVITTEEITYLPLTKVTLAGEDLEVFTKLYEQLDDLDDVQEVYHNVSE